MFLLFSHKLSEVQMQTAREEFEVSEFVYLPDDLQKLWSNIDPDIGSLKDILALIKHFLQENADHDDIALIQGDFGACYIMANFCKELGVIPVYATTKRLLTEYIDESRKTIKKSTFEFRRFREYGN
jgi:hypothetical protein